MKQNSLGLENSLKNARKSGSLALVNMNLTEFPLEICKFSELCYD